jgi:hypothetical protein
MSPILSTGSQHRLAPGRFLIGVGLVYLLGLLSQTLLSAPVTARLGVVPFALAQAALIGAWIVLHRLRLRDAGRPAAIVTGIAAIYALEVVLLIIVVGLMLGSGGGGAGREATLLNVFVILSLLTLLSSDIQFGAPQIWIAAIMVLLALPVIIGLGFSAWTATRPSVARTAP